MIATRRPHVALLLLAGVVTSTALLACNRNAADNADEEEHHHTVTDRLTFTPTEPATEARVASLVAEVIVPEDAAWAIGPGAAGRLERWEVGIGDRVEAGSPLARLVNYEQTDLGAQVAEARAAASQRRANLTSREDAQRLGVASAAEVEEARSAYAEAQARANALQRSSRARAANAQNGVWTSPVTGVVASLLCAPGASVDAGEACVTILDVDKAAIRVHVPERLVATLNDDLYGQWFAWGGEAAPVRVVPQRRAPTIDPQSRTQAYDFRAATGTARLFPGQSGRLDLYEPAQPTWMRVPSAALTSLDGEDIVFRTVDGEELPQPAVVQIIARDKDHAIIESSELSVQEPVVTEGVFLLRSLAIAALGGGHGH